LVSSKCYWNLFNNFLYRVVETNPSINIING
jgi:hypothetical protein